MGLRDLGYDLIWGSKRRVVRSKYLCVLPKALDLACRHGFRGLTGESRELGIAERGGDACLDAPAFLDLRARGALDGGDDDGAAPARGGEQPGVRQLAIGAGDGVQVDAEVGGELPYRRQFIALRELPCRDEAAQAGDELVVDRDRTGERDREHDGHCIILCYNGKYGRLLRRRL
jgi:hypothetical protein